MVLRGPLQRIKFSGNFKVPHHARTVYTPCNNTPKVPLLTQFSFATHTTSMSDPLGSKSFTGCNINMETLAQLHRRLRFSFPGGMETQYLQYRSATVIPIMLFLAVAVTPMIIGQIVMWFCSPPPPTQRPALILALHFVGLATCLALALTAPLRCCPLAVVQDSWRRVWLWYLAIWVFLAVGVGKSTVLTILGEDGMFFESHDGIMIKIFLLHNLQVLSFWDALSISLGCGMIPLCVVPNTYSIPRLVVGVLVSVATGWLGETSTRRDFVLQQTLQGKEAESKFLARMSHEIRTPLLGICGFFGAAAGNSAVHHTAGLRQQHEQCRHITEKHRE